MIDLLSSGRRSSFDDSSVQKKLQPPDEGAKLPERLGIDAVEDVSSAPPGGEQPRFLQDLDVLHRGRVGERHDVRQIGTDGLALLEG
jgi:hypothetical protein